MAYEITQKLKNIVAYEPTCNVCKIRLDANESFIALSEQLIHDIVDSVKKVAYNRYPDPLATEVIDLYANLQGINRDCLTAGNGSDELISLICTAFLNKGDKVITLTPDFLMYQFYCALTENPVIQIPKNEQLQIEIDRLIESVKANNARAIFFSNPCNPTSLGISAQDVCTILRSVDALVVLDEAYMDFWDQSLLSKVEEFDNLIILRTCSKAYGMAAIRLGFAAANSEITKALRSAKSPYNVNAVTQAIGAAVLRRKHELQGAIQKIIKSRNELYNSLCDIEKSNAEKIKVYETRTNFVFVKLQNAKVAYDFLCQNDISVRLLGDYLRITAGSEYENEQVILKLKEYITKEV